MMRKYILGIIFMITTILSPAQETFPVNGVRDQRADTYAFTNVNVVVKAGQTLNNAVLLIKNGKIEAVGTGLKIPSGYATIDLQGKYLYPSFIDIFSSYGLPKPERTRGNRWGGTEQIQPETTGPYNANEAVKSEYNAFNEFSVINDDAEKFIKMGFGAVLTHRKDGLMSGTSALVTLANDNENNVVINPKAANHLSFSKGSSLQMYPVSEMGYIAVIRQTYLDEQWYSEQKNRPFTDMTLEALSENKRLPQIFDSNGGWMKALRADKIGDEFAVQYIIKGGGDEYQRISDIKNMNSPMIIPLGFPDAYDVDDAWDAQRVSLKDMKHWELAPSNPAFLEKYGVTFALTSNGSNDFLAEVRKAIDYGMTEETALNALTVIPAKLIHAEQELGSIEAGKLANFLITSGNIFDEKTIIYENWIQGQRHRFTPLNQTNHSGQFDLTLNGIVYKLEITGEPSKYSAKIIINDSTDIPVNLNIEGNVVDLNFKPEKDADKIIRLTGWVNDKEFKGEGILDKGQWTTWTATKTAVGVKEENNNKQDENKLPELGEIIYPFIAYGSAQQPKQETILIKNATLWTNEEDGVLENTDILVKDGKIAKIGKGLSDAADRVIEAKGLHVTPGVIDEHSHLAASAINDVAVNSGMVRIFDVIDSEDIGVYHALGGGVTALQTLHGSANPIGGQSSLIKLRWGSNPEGYRIQGADGFIKFALGENVKRSRSSSSIRYPQTRMGVEQVYMDAFTNGKEYDQAWKKYNSLSKKEKAKTSPPRRDLALETMAEIINSERFISCHSYVQSEIGMLMGVAEKFNFKINTFTHILEGYKVADRMKEHGVGGSTFADWWNYKWEVRYAIPYNATIMHKEGVVTAINSDSEEFIRRLNQEAAKSIKYGGMSEEDALKMVTLNPAKLLHLDDRMGSLKVGKDADIVVWTDHPLSIYAKASTTIIDGIVYFDLKKDQELRDYIALERARIIEKMKGAKKSGGKSSKRFSAEKVEFHCEDVLGLETDHQE